MRLVRSLAGFLYLAVGSASGAQEKAVPPSIDALLTQEGQAYEQARQVVLERPDLVDDARTALAGREYGPSTWRRLVLTEALSMHLDHPEEADALRNLLGLDRDHYRRRRIPGPSVDRELGGLRHVAPLMIELFLKGVEAYEWSSPETAEAEAAALRRGLLMAVGESGHTASVHFLVDVVEGGCVCCASCDTAVRALGETGDLRALPLLLRTLSSARAEAKVGEIALVVSALGGIRHDEVWPHIRAELSNPDRIVREAAIRSAADFANRWHWRTDPARGERIRATVGPALLDVLLETEEQELVVALLESLGLVATPQLRALLEQRLADTSGRAASASSAAEGERIRRALERVDRVLGRQQPRERAR